MKFDSRDLALTAVFAALYAVINLVQSFSPFGNPSVYGPIQLRIADFLIAVAALLGLLVVVGSYGWMRCGERVRTRRICCRDLRFSC